MSVEQHWRRFVRAVKRRSPQSPHEPPTQRQQARGNANRAITLSTSFLDGLDVNIPFAGPIGVVTAAATANSPGDFANAMVDQGVSTGASTLLGGMAGPLVGGVISLFRGAHQALERSDAMVTYLLGMGGYVNCLARYAVGAVNDAVHYSRAPNPLIPDYIRERGDLYSDWRREAFLNGVRRAIRMVNDFDNIRPTSGDHYSKSCLIQLAVLAGLGGGRADASTRQAVESYILSNILLIDLRQAREQLRRWANSPD